jgi:2-C-methyl-D-erythritol 4-phosphate cytidylyltransferase
MEMRCSSSKSGSQVKRIAIIVAGGKGARMQSELPKQFIELNGLPIVVHTINAFREAYPAIEIILVLPELHLSLWDAIQSGHEGLESVKTTIGGVTRFQSVRNGLKCISDTTAIVAIHDAVRPCINTKTIRASYEAAESKGSAIVTVPLKDSIRKKKTTGTKAVNRADYLLVQTPQVFRLDWLKEAYQQAEEGHFTDDASVVENAGYELELVMGHYENIKITTSEDLEAAALYLNKKP